MRVTVDWVSMKTARLCAVAIEAAVVAAAIDVVKLRRAGSGFMIEPHMGKEGMVPLGR